MQFERPPSVSKSKGIYEILNKYSLIHKSVRYQYSMMIVTTICLLVAGVTAQNGIFLLYVHEFSAIL